MVGIYYILLGLTVGAAATLAITMAVDKHKRVDSIYNHEKWCSDNCKMWTECFGKHKDTDDAMKDLMDYCSKYCPIAIAEDIILEDTNREN